MNVLQLRKQGYRVRVHHIREHQQRPHSRLPETVVSPRGGQTEVEITTPDGETVFGTSYCAGIDNYCKKIGVQIAVGRAMKQLR